MGNPNDTKPVRSRHLLLQLNWHESNELMLKIFNRLSVTVSLVYESVCKWVNVKCFQAQ